LLKRIRSARALFAIAEWLFDHHGLTLQPAKTRVLTAASFQRRVSHGYEQRLEAKTERMYAMWRVLKADYGDPGADPTETHRAEFAEFLSAPLERDLRTALKGPGANRLRLGEIHSRENWVTS
jgi:hypothetical protein